MNERVLVAAAAALSWGRAVWASGSGVPTPREAEVYAAALDMASAWGQGDVATLLAGTVERTPSGVLTLWEGLWLAIAGKSSTVAVASMAPFHALAAWGLWRGGNAVGGRLGGAWALVGGLGAAGVLAYGAETRAAFPLFACVAGAAGAGLARRWGATLVSGLGAAALAAGTVGTLVSSPVTTLLDLAGPALLVGVVAALLLRGNALTLGLLAGAAAGFGAVAAFDLEPLLVVPLLAIAAAGIGSTRPAALAFSALAAAQIVGFHTAREGWPGRPASLRPNLVAGEPFAIDPVLDWLVARIPEGATSARVALLVSPTPTLHEGLFVTRALERGDSLTFTPIDGARPLDTLTDLGLVVTRAGTHTPRDGWRAQLPAPTESRSWRDGYRVDLWDRGLPPETLLASPEAAEARNHPFRQALYAYVDGAEVGPLLENASSAEVVVTGAGPNGGAGREALFVRNQALWRARAGLGTRFEAERPLLDADGNELFAFDPTLVALPDGTVRLYAAELVGEERGLDPASHPTRIVSWRGASLDALVREPGARLEGVGLVDPAVVRDTDGAWRMYVTVARSRVAAAVSEDGLAFGPLAPVTDGTVPAPTPFGLVVQRQVMGWSVLYVVPDPANPTPTAEGSLELCATGASFADRLYYTRAEEPCPEPVVLASRRTKVLDPLLRLARTE